LQFLNITVHEFVPFVLKDIDKQNMQIMQSNAV